MPTDQGRGNGPAFQEGGAFLLLRGSRVSGAFGVVAGLAVAALAGDLLHSASLSAQPTGPPPSQASEWNGPRVLDMIREARDVRQRLIQDSTLHSYSSEARGYVYFYIDRRDTGERILVKTDQIALEVYWQAPGRIRQRIVGLRDEKSLPTNIHYHLDHLVVVQDEFGDRIRIGDGDEVEAVVHPAAPGSEAVYDFLLSDSITLTLPSTMDTVRVYEVQVRPRDFEAPGFVGNVFLDRDTKSIVRMSFTFTPASYVDPYLHHISISLENGLWEGRYWLPYRQQLEIRREVPYLDIPAGSVIRGSFEVRGYQINVPLPPTLFIGPTITALPEATRRSFPFEEELHSQLDEEGLQGFQPPPEMDEIQSLAVSIATEQYLSGLRRSRLFLPSPFLSSVVRHNRSEGLFLGAGVSHVPRPFLGLFLYGGYSFGRERPTLELRMTGGERNPSTQLHIFKGRLRDLGPMPAISGLLNSMASLVLKQDYTDLYFSTGVSATQTFSVGPENRLEITGRWEKQSPGRDVVSSDLEDTAYRPVVWLERGTWTSVEAAGSFATPWKDLQLSVEGLLGHFDDGANAVPDAGVSPGYGSGTFGSLAASLSYRRRWLSSGTTLTADLRGGNLFGDPPLQARHFLGGRQTVPGYAFRTQIGDRYWLARFEASKDIFPPFLSLRAFGNAGRAWGGDLILETLSTSVKDPPVLISAGLGLAFGWDVLRLDFARGLREGGEWQAILSVRPDFWPFL